jgi:hypothetical protein
MRFSNYRDNFEPETLAVLDAAFNEAWYALQTSRGEFDKEATKRALADLIMSFAAEKAKALAALPYVLAGTPDPVAG